VNKAKLTELLKKYKHGWVFGYIIIYLPWFMMLERYWVPETSNYHIIYSRVDDMIPFIEYFIIPYFLWFPLIAAAFLYFFFVDVDEFYKMAKLMFAGMTIFLIISTIFPNGLDIRPVYFYRENMFVEMVRGLHRADTPTNVLPSLHVFNTLAVCIALHLSQPLRKRVFIRWSAYLLGTLIILSTMFLKQHSVIDVVAGILMAYTLYQFIYAPEAKRAEASPVREVVKIGRK